jgi:hypothetical protein
VNACALLAFGRNALDHRSGQDSASCRNDFSPHLWCSRTTSPRSRMNTVHIVTVHIWKGLCASWIHAFVCIGYYASYAMIIRWGGTCSILSAMTIFKNETHNIFSAIINRWFDIDGPCSENSSASFLREQISTKSAHRPCRLRRDAKQCWNALTWWYWPVSKQTLNQCEEVCRIEKNWRPATGLNHLKGHLACTQHICWLALQTRRHATETGFMGFVNSGRFKFLNLFVLFCLSNRILNGWL